MLATDFSSNYFRFHVPIANKCWPVPLEFNQLFPSLLRYDSSHSPMEILLGLVFSVEINLWHAEAYKHATWLLLILTQFFHLSTASIKHYISVRFAEKGKILNNKSMPLWSYIFLVILKCYSTRHYKKYEH